MPLPFEFYLHGGLMEAFKQPFIAPAAYLKGRAYDVIAYFV